MILSTYYRTNLSGYLLILPNLVLAIYSFSSVMSDLLVSFVHAFALLYGISWSVCTWLSEGQSAFFTFVCILVMVLIDTFTTWCVCFIMPHVFIKVICKHHHCICIGHFVLTVSTRGIVLLLLVSPYVSCSFCHYSAFPCYLDCLGFAAVFSVTTLCAIHPGPNVLSWTAIVDPVGISVCSLRASLILISFVCLAFNML